MVAWGSEAFARKDLETAAPTVAGIRPPSGRGPSYLRAAASPGSAFAMHEQWWETDVRGVLPTVRAPTLILTRPGAAHVELAAEFIETLHQAIPDTTLVELPGRDLPYWIGEAGAFVAEIEEFFTGTRSAPDDTDRVLATVLFTDIVGSTSHAAISATRVAGDPLEAPRRGAGRRWRGTEVDRHDGRRVPRHVRRAGSRRSGARGRSPPRWSRSRAPGPRRYPHGRGREVRRSTSAGSPWRSARGWRRSPSPPRSSCRSTVKDLVAGSDLTFGDAGEHELKGVPDRWHLFRVVA